MPEPSNDRKKGVLEDHQRKGKTFIPPFTAQLGPLREVSWIKRILPETIWIALLQQISGLREGVHLIQDLAREARGLNQTTLFGSVSSFWHLSREEFEVLRSRLAAKGTLFALQRGLAPLVSLYPECPLRNLYTMEQVEKTYLPLVKSLVAQLYDRTGREAVLAQSTFIYLAFDAGVLHVREGLTLEDFPQVEDYPETQRSREVAASVRATISVFFGEPYYDGSRSWPDYFWNRGLELESCSLASAGGEGDRELDAPA